MSLLSTISDATALFMLWLFVTAGIGKINPENSLYFSDLFASYGWRNIKVANIIAKIIGFIEIIIGIAIIFPTTRAFASLIAIGLLFAYLVNMTFQLVQGRRELDCGCSGAASQLKISGHLLLRNVFLIGVAFFALAPGNIIEIDIGLLSIFFALVAIVIYQSCEQLIGNAQKLKILRES
jgi:uncharacterized membrane protein YphA (DoxX/SURF4 family)